MLGLQGLDLLAELLGVQHQQLAALDPRIQRRALLGQILALRDDVARLARGRLTQLLQPRIDLGQLRCQRRDRGFGIALRIGHLPDQLAQHLLVVGVVHAAPRVLQRLLGAAQQGLRIGRLWLVLRLRGRRRTQAQEQQQQRTAQQWQQHGRTGRQAHEGDRQ